MFTCAANIPHKSIQSVTRRESHSIFGIIRRACHSRHSTSTSTTLLLRNHGELEGHILASQTAVDG